MKLIMKTHAHRILSLLVAVAIIFGTVPITVFAEKEPDDAYATSGVTISGTEEEDGADDTDDDTDANDPDNVKPATNGVTVAHFAAPFAAETEVNSLEALKQAIEGFENATEDTTITVSGEISVTKTLIIPANTDGKGLTITGGTLKRGIDGTLFTVQSGGTLTLKNITIDGNNKGAFPIGSVPAVGTLVKIESGATLTMNDGAKLQNNSANGQGGGIHNSGTVNMNGTASISGNTADSGGGIHNNGGKVNINDTASITGNAAGSNGGGGVRNAGTLTIGGKATITGNYKIAEPNTKDNVRLVSSYYITLGTGANGVAEPDEMSIGVSHPNGIGATIVNSGAEDGDEDYFFADDDTKEVVFDNEALKLAAKATPPSNTLDLSLTKAEIEASNPARFSVNEATKVITANGLDPLTIKGDGSTTNWKIYIPDPTSDRKALEITIEDGTKIIAASGNAFESNLQAIINFTGEGSDITIQGGNASQDCGIKARQQFYLRGTLGNITGGGNGISASSHLYIYGTVGNITGTAGYGIHALSTGGTINAGATVGDITGGISGIVCTSNGYSPSIAGTVGNISGGQYGVETAFGFSIGTNATVNSISGDECGVYQKSTGGTSVPKISIEGTVTNGITGGTHGIYSDATANSNAATITISKATGVTGTNGDGIHIDDSRDITIDLKGSAKIKGGRYGIYANSNVSITCIGTVGTVMGEVEAENTGVYSQNGAITIGVPITVSSNSARAFNKAPTISLSKYFTEYSDSADGSNPTKADSYTWDEATPHKYVKLDVVRYGITLTPSDNKDFGSVPHGYSAQTAHTVTVANIGANATGTLAFVLSGINANSFTVSASTSSIGAGSSRTFTVVPKTGLAVGTYEATVTVSAASNNNNPITAQSFDVSFTVDRAPLTGADAGKVAPTAPVKNATPDTDFTETDYTGTVTWSPTDNPFKGDTEYTATVTLNAKDGVTFDSGFTPTITDGTLGTVTVSPDGKTATYTITYPKTGEKEAKDITIDTQPTTTAYYAGEKLDVTGLVVTVTYDDGTSETVSPEKYYIDNVEVIPDKTVLTAAQNGGTLTVEYGGESETVGTITVASPPVIGNVTVTDITSSGAIISYAATQGTHNISVNKLEYKTGSGNWLTATSGTPITGLSPDTVYQYRVTVSDGTKTVISSGSFKTAAENPPSGGADVDGEVEDDTNPTTMTVTLKLGNTVIASTQAIQRGSTDYYDFSFTNVPDGIYNLVVDNGEWIVTQAVIVKNGVVVSPANDIEINMKSGKTQSVVEINGADTPPAAVGGLPELFEASAGVLTNADELELTQGGKVEIKLAVEKVDNPTDASMITTTQTIGLYLDLSVIKSRFDSTGALLNETNLTNLGSNLIAITFELPTSMHGETVAAVYRVHDDGSGKKVHTLTKTTTPEYFEQNGNMITLHVGKFSTYAIAYTQSSPPTPPSPPTSSPSSGGGSSAGGNRLTSPAPAKWVDDSDAKALAKSAKEQGADSVRTSSTGEAGIRKKALHELGKSDLTYRHDTIADSAVQVRVYVDEPGKATKDILVSGYTSGTNVDKTKAILGKWFSNDVAVIALDQQGDFGMNVRIAAKVDLSGLDTSKLYFYSYDKATNKYKLIVTEYRIDSKGYVHFSTVLGGSIIITDRPLTKNGADEDRDIYEPPMTGGLDNPTTGGDGMGMYIPPAKAQPQDFAKAESIIETVADDGVLTLQSKTAPASITNSGDVLKINLDSPEEMSILQESGKPSVGLIVGIAIAMLFAAMILWAVIPRKDDVLEL